MKAIFKILDLSETISSESEYSHEMNFSSLEDGRMELKTMVKDEVNLKIASDLTHLVLSEKPAYERLGPKHWADQIFKSVESPLFRKSNDQNFNIKANIFYSIYRTIK